MNGLLPFGKRQSVAIGALLCAASAVVPAVWGDGVTPSEVELLDGVAWLSNDATGDVVRVNGETGRVDASVGLGGAAGEMDVEQASGSVLVRVGAEVRSIDVSNLDWGATAPSATGMVVSQSIAYLVDLDGEVRALDPVTLEVRGNVSLDAAPLSVTLAGDRLVAALDDGSVKVVEGDEIVADLDVGATGDRVTVTALGDQVTVLNLSQGELRRLNPETGRARRKVEVDLPSGEIVVPQELPRGRLWVLAERTGQLVGIDARTGDTERIVVAEGRSDLTGPVVMSGRVFLVDRTAATLVEVDAIPLRVLRQEPLGIEDASRVELMAEGGKVFVNDPNSSLAMVIDGEQYRIVDKYNDEGVAEAPSDVPAPPGEAPADDGGPAPAAPVPAPGPVAPPLAPPATPAQVQAVAGNESASVSWSYGAGGGAPGAFHVTWDGGRTIDVPGGQLSVDVGGLTNGERYVFEVWASNDVGDSGRARSNAVEPNDEVPGQPGNVQAESDDGAAQVSWSAADGRGNDIDHYIVTGAPGGLTQEVPGNRTSVDFGGLTNGQTYTFTVTAVNNLGNQSAASEPSNQVMPYGPPGEVPGTNVEVGDGSADLNWEPAENLSETPVNYDITVTPAPGSGGTDSTQDTSYGITGMENGVSYTVTITPRNDRGSGPSTDVPVRPGKAPEVSGVGAERTGDRQFRVSYSVDRGGRDVTNCTVAISGGGSTGCDPSAGSVTVDVPQYDTGYTFTVTVTTELGDGQGSADGTSAGKSLTVDASADRWNGATCSWPGHENTRPILRGTEVCTGFVAWVPNRTTVTASCWTTGTQHQDDYLNQTNRYVRVTWNGTTGYMSVLYFTNYQDQDGIVSGLRRC